MSVRSCEVGAGSGHRAGGWREAVRREAQADAGNAAGRALLLETKGLLPGRPREKPAWLGARHV